MSLKNGLLLIIALWASFTLVACGYDNSNSAPQATDYSQAAHWLSLPSSVKKEVDVFYLYPTAWQSVDESNPHICEIDDASMLKNAPAAFARQATAFETVGNIYAPYYRQDDMSPIDREKVIAGIPTLDAVAAFDYYIKHYNNGHPFILAGHSQGSNVLCNLLAGYMKDNPDVYKKMVAAYVIGYSVTTPVAGAILPILFPPASVNHILPSGPDVIPNGTLLAVTSYSVITPSTVILPILSTPDSVNQRLPSGPDTMPFGLLSRFGKE